MRPIAKRNRATVEDLMSRQVHACRSEHALDEAARLMWEHDCGWVPVTDDAGQPLGVVTDRDVCMAAYTQGRDLKSILVGDVMTRGLVTCDPTTTPAEAEALMAEHQVRRLPVVADGRLVGVVSLNDLALASMGRPRRVTIKSIAETLARIGEHRRPVGAQSATG